MDVKFIPATKKEYTVLRDYYVSNDQIQGIFFLLYDETEKQLLTRFLKKDEISNEEVWRKKKFLGKQVISLVVEKGKGKENKVVLERGTLNIRKKNIFDDITDKKKPAERVTFYLAPSVFKPF